jgi:hypothetical protein
MRRRSRLPARIVATAVALVVAVWSTAVCVLAGSSPHTSHACCAKKRDDVDRVAAPRSCCAENTPNYFASGVAPVPTLAPPVVPALPGIADELQVPAHARTRSTDLEIVRPPGTPTYLAVSNFRL